MQAVDQLKFLNRAKEAHQEKLRNIDSEHKDTMFKKFKLKGDNYKPNSKHKEGNSQYNMSVSFYSV